MFSRSAANTIGFPTDCGDVICALAEMNPSQLECSQKVFQIYYSVNNVFQCIVSPQRSRV
jgi:hypothetical protein